VCEIPAFYERRILSQEIGIVYEANGVISIVTSSTDVGGAMSVRLILSYLFQS
jgi:hypothetical protein